MRRRRRSTLRALIVDAAVLLLLVGALMAFLQAGAIRSPGNGRPIRWVRADANAQMSEVAVRERAWFGVHDWLPDGWRVGPLLRHPHTGRWTVTALSPRYRGRGSPPAVVEGRGADEIAALTDLSVKLDDLRAIERRMAIEAKARAAYLHGPEDRSRATLGRPLTPDVLQRVVRRYAADEVRSKA